MNDTNNIKTEQEFDGLILEQTNALLAKLNTNEVPSASLFMSVKTLFFLQRIDARVANIEHYLKEIYRGGLPR